MSQIRKSGFASYVVFFSMLGVTVLSSCRSGTDPALVADTSVSFNEGVAAYEAGNFEEGVEKLSAAIEGHGLSPDQFSSAIVKRAVCYGRLQKFAEAHADLDEAERGAPNMDEVHQARHFVFLAEGKSGPASAALREAKKCNPKIKAIK